ncbi:MAG: MarR family transcriptional regulator [Candidatus Saccharimonadales bacterium]
MNDMTLSTTNSEFTLSSLTTYEVGVMQSTAHRLTSKVKSQFLSQYELTAMQWFALGYINDSSPDGMSLTALKDILDTTMPFITNTINLLESKGLIRKVTKPGDNRTKIVYLNPSYKPLIKQIEAGLRDELRKELYGNDAITRDELQTYVDVLYKMVEHRK